MTARPNVFGGGTLDRAAERRSDATWVQAAWAQAEARVAPLWRGKVLLAGTQSVMLPGQWGRSLLEQPTPPRWAFLGLQDGAPVFALDLSACDRPELAIPPDHGTFADLLEAATALPQADAALLAYARAVLHWRERHRCCGICGHECRAERAGHTLVCPSCGVEHFPRTDGAVIMLVTSGARALLGRSARFANRNMYSTLAGFVEPGESLEEAVAREVLEETAVRVGRVWYHSSQPWPFPSGIMLGFFAEALTDAIRVDPTELIDARWFTRAELRGADLELPPLFSIARRLIEEWAAN